MTSMPACTRRVPALGRHLDSPADWRDELIYFLLPDRFSDGSAMPDGDILKPEADGRRPADTNPFPGSRYENWRWDLWAISGRNRFQGGTIKGVELALDYLSGLGVTALWIGPVWKQRAVGTDVNRAGDGTDDVFTNPWADLADDKVPPSPESILYPRDDYHGYAVQDFTEIDPRFGTKQDLVDLVAAAHTRDIRVVLDVIINHTAVNFDYAAVLPDPRRPPYRPPFRYDFGSWLDVENRPTDRGQPHHGQLAADDGVWPEELQHENLYHRMGEGDYGVGLVDDPIAEFRVADYRNRDLLYGDERPDPVLTALTKVWQDWMDLTDCDGFRVDTLLHVPLSVARDFTADIRKHAKRALCKDNFLVVGEVGGPDAMAASYLRIDGLSVLSLGQRRRRLRALAGGAGGSPADVLRPTFADLDVGDGTRMDSQAVERLTWLARYRPEALLRAVVTTVDDHDGLGVDRPGSRIAREHGPNSVVPALALLLFGPGVPCMYYGTEQALCGPVGAGTYLDDLGLDDGGGARRGADRYLREAMFGPVHPLRAGLAGRSSAAAHDRFDHDLPGFGPAGTTGKHVFDVRSPWYRAVAHLAGLRKAHPVLRTGDITVLSRGSREGGRFGDPLPQSVIAWERRSRTATAIIVVNVATDSGFAPVLDLELPSDAAGVEYRRLARTSALMDGRSRRPTGPRQTDIGKVVTVVRRPQSAIASLAVGAVGPGEVQVFVSV